MGLIGKLNCDTTRRESFAISYYSGSSARCTSVGSELALWSLTLKRDGGAVEFKNMMQYNFVSSFGFVGEVGRVTTRLTALRFLKLAG